MNWFFFIKDSNYSVVYIYARQWDGYIGAFRLSNWCLVLFDKSKYVMDQGIMISIQVCFFDFPAYMSKDMFCKKRFR